MNGCIFKIDSQSKYNGTKNDLISYLIILKNQKKKIIFLNNCFIMIFVYLKFSVSSISLCYLHGFVIENAT